MPGGHRGVAEIPVGCHHHAGESHHIGLHGGELVAQVQAGVLVTDTCYMEIHVHPFHLADELKQLLGGTCTGHVYAGCYHIVGEAVLEVGQGFLLTSQPIWASLSATRRPMPEVAPIITIFFISNGFSIYTHNAVYGRLVHHIRSLTSLASLDNHSVNFDSCHRNRLEI